MIVLAAAALLAAYAAEPTPYDLGRASFLTGMCVSLGWEGSRERAVAFADAYDVRNPTDDMAGRQAEISRGVQEAQADMETVVDAFRATADVAAFKEAIKTRCDAVVHDIPGLLSRADGTQAAFDAAVDGLVGQIPGNSRPQ